MSGFEWFLVIVVVILVPLAIAVAVTLWTLEQARKRNRRNRPDEKAPGVARKATQSGEGAPDEQGAVDDDAPWRLLDETAAQDGRQASGRHDHEDEGGVRGRSR